MLTVSLHKPEFLSFSHYGFRDLHKFSRIPSSWTIAMSNYSGSSETRKKEELSIQVPPTSISSSETQRLAGTDLRFDRLQVPEKELMHDRKFEFGQFVAREAVIDEEYWTAAWLRAESHWEGRNDRYVDNHKRKFAEQEFHAMKRRRTSLHGQKCRCIIMVRKEDKHVKRTVLKGVVGTLDLSVRCLLHGETFPGERVKAPLFCSIHGTGPNRYGYVANLCVPKSARRQGIATNMLHFAIELVKSNGIEHAYVHVHRNNTPAQKLYEKMGFEIVEAASSQLVEEQTYLLCCKA
ncbi:hypothetical protein NC651_016204 [Populus alba x Populus x berolinensis]|uniref:N-acetyltransferase domain-containing protein n=1 Tax=Populus davidiana TaxID=266767 RepID=A0A6M2EU02_9ROSI|nr:hypothetical protein NC651_016204 [Populus alba x Populus x berolinensis]